MPWSPLSWDFNSILSALLTWQHDFPHCPSSCQQRILGSLCSLLLMDSLPANLEETEVIKNKDDCRKILGKKKHISGAYLCQRVNDDLNWMSQRTPLFTYWEKSFSNLAETERQTKYHKSQGRGLRDGSEGKGSCRTSLTIWAGVPEPMTEAENQLLRVVLQTPGEYPCGHPTSPHTTDIHTPDSRGSACWADTGLWDAEQCCRGCWWWPHSSVPLNHAHRHGYSGKVYVTHTSLWWFQYLPVYLALN